MGFLWLMCFISWILMSSYVWQQYLSRNPTWTIYFQQSEDKKENFHFYSQAICCLCYWRCRNNTGVEAKNKTAVYLPLLEPKKWYAQWSGAAVCFSKHCHSSLYLISPLSPSFSTAHIPLLFFALFFFFRLLQRGFPRCGHTSYVRRVLWGCLSYFVCCFKGRLIVDKTE